jgi:hypothetical protein
MYSQEIKHANITKKRNKQIDVNIEKMFMCIHLCHIYMHVKNIEK